MASATIIHGVIAGTAMERAGCPRCSEESVASPVAEDGVPRTRCVAGELVLVAAGEKVATSTTMNCVRTSIAKQLVATRAAGKGVSPLAAVDKHPTKIADDRRMVSLVIKKDVGERGIWATDGVRVNLAAAGACRYRGAPIMKLDHAAGDGDGQIVGFTPRSIKLNAEVARHCRPHRDGWPHCSEYQAQRGNRGSPHHSHHLALALARSICPDKAAPLATIPHCGTCCKRPRRFPFFCGRRPWHRRNQKFPPIRLSSSARCGRPRCARSEPSGPQHRVLSPGPPTSPQASAGARRTGRAPR